MASRTGLAWVGFGLGIGLLCLAVGFALGRWSSPMQPEPEPEAVEEIEDCTIPESFDVQQSSRDRHEEDIQAIDRRIEHEQILIVMRATGGDRSSAVPSLDAYNDLLRLRAAVCEITTSPHWYGLESDGG